MGKSHFLRFGVSSIDLLRGLLIISVVGLLCASLGGVSVAGVGAQSTAPTTPIDSEPDDTDTENGRIVPSEQVPAGIRTTYGDSELQRPSGGAGSTVAVVDTGVDRIHPDLESRVTLCRDFTGDSVRRGSCTDRNGHGTHVAGTIAADGGSDDLGIYGVAPEAEIYAFKACRDDGSCGADPLAQAVRTATDEGADVIVLSLGGRTEPRIQAATEYATDNGALVVAASGNSGPNTGSILYPAAHPNVIAVGAVEANRGGTVAPDEYRVPDFSSRGVDEPFSGEADGSLEVAAYGVDVLSPAPDREYGVKTGTSMATPHVAGLLAKILAASPANATVAERRSELRERASRYDVMEGRHARPGYDPAAGFGVPTVSQPQANFTVTPTIPVSDEVFVLDARPSQSDAPIVEYRWDTTNDTHFERTGEQIELQTPPGTHSITLRVIDAENASATVSRDVFVNDRPRVTVRNPSPRAGENATLTARIENEYGETTVTWQFPDGTTATGETASYRFEPGNSTVRVTVTDEFGATTTESVTVTTTTETQGPVLSPLALGIFVVVLLVLAARPHR